MEVEWEDINLQDLVEEARAELYHQQAEALRREKAERQEDGSSVLSGQKEPSPQSSRRGEER